MSLAETFSGGLATNLKKSFNTIKYKYSDFSDRPSIFFEAIYISTAFGISCPYGTICVSFLTTSKFFAARSRHSEIFLSWSTSKSFESSAIIKCLNCSYIMMLLSLHKDMEHGIISSYPCGCGVRWCFGRWSLAPFFCFWSHHSIFTHETIFAKINCV